MSGETQSSDTDLVDRAFNRVLAAEAEARERLEACRREAADLVSGAALRTRAIADLADRRMQLAHRVADRGVERALAGLLATAAARDADADERGVLARLERAVAALADEILGSGPGVGP